VAEDVLQVIVEHHETPRVVLFRHAFEDFVPGILEILALFNIEQFGLIEDDRTG
jgi:hypothetical protein